MILVILGTQDKSFTRLLQLLEDYIMNNAIKEKVIVQSGFTKFETTVMEIRESIPHSELKKLMKKATFIICHGGVGTIMDALEEEKKIIAVPRLRKYREHDNDHQIQIIQYFEKLGCILSLSENENLKSKIEELGSTDFKKYQRGNDKIIHILKKFIENN